MLAHYEDNLSEAIKYLNEDDITRMAQVMYLLKCKNYPNIWCAIENRVHELAEFGDFDTYHLTNILRSFSRS